MLLLGQPQRLHDGGNDELRLASVLQRHKTYPLGKGLPHVVGHSQSQVRLTHASTTGECEQAYVRTQEQIVRRLHLPLASNERSEWYRHIPQAHRQAVGVCTSRRG